MSPLIRTLSYCVQSLAVVTTKGALHIWSLDVDLKSKEVHFLCSHCVLRAQFRIALFLYFSSKFNL